MDWVCSEKRNLPCTAWRSQSEPECQEGWFRLVWLDIRTGMTHMTLSLCTFYFCACLLIAVLKSRKALWTLSQNDYLKVGKSLSPAHKQPGGHQSVVLKSYRKLGTHIVRCTDLISRGAALPWERLDLWAPSSSTWGCEPPAASHHLLTMFSHILALFVSTTAAPRSSLCWQPTENLIKSWSFHASSSVYLFLVKCHLADSTPNAAVHVQQHGEEVLQRDFPTDTFSLTYLCPTAWSCYMFINIITATTTIGLGTLALQTVSQEQCGVYVSMVSAGSFLHLWLRRCLKPTVTTATGI